jgi:hypothetical protein
MQTQWLARLAGVGIGLLIGEGVLKFVAGFLTAPILRDIAVLIHSGAIVLLIVSVMGFVYLYLKGALQ